MSPWITTAIGGAGGGLLALAAVPPGSRGEAIRRLIVATGFSVLLSNGALQVASIAARAYFPSLPEIVGNDVALMVSGVFGVLSWWVVLVLCTNLEKRKGIDITAIPDLMDQMRGDPEERAK